MKTQDNIIREIIGQHGFPDLTNWNSVVNFVKLCMNEHTLELLKKITGVKEV